MQAELQALFLKQTASSHVAASITLALLRKLRLRVPAWRNIRFVRKLAKKRKTERTFLSLMLP